MAEQAMIPVKFEGQQYEVPQELLAADTRDGSRLVQQYIQEEIADKEFRAEQSKVKQERAYEAEFTSIQKRLSAVESKDKIINNLQRENASLAAAVEAQAKQIEALESSGADAGSASANARQVAYDLANASTIGHGTLSELQRANEQMQRQVTDMQARLDEYDLLFQKQAEDAQAAGVNQQRLQQEASNAALQKAYDAEARAAAAEAVASKAERDAEAAQLLTTGHLTKGDITDAVSQEWRAQQQAITNAVAEQLRDEYPDGIQGQRMDANLVRRQRSDVANYSDPVGGQG